MSVDATRCADFENHLSFASKYFHIYKTIDSRTEAWFFRKPLTLFLFTIEHDQLTMTLAFEGFNCEK